MRSVLLAGFFGRFRPSSAAYLAHPDNSPKRAICDDQLACCFKNHKASAVAYCSSLPTATSIKVSFVTVTVTVTSTAKPPVNTAAAISPSAYCPPKPKFSRAQGDRPLLYLSACICVGVPRKTIMKAATSTKTEVCVRPPRASSPTRTSTTTTSSSTSTSTTSTTSSTTSSTTTSVLPTPSDMSTDYINAALVHHNIHRVNHSAPDVIWDPTLYLNAKAVAQTCTYAYTNPFIDDAPAGQNIGAGYPATVAGIGALITGDFYYAQVNNYAPYYGQANPGGDFSTYSQFTQLVWYNTMRIGCYTMDCSATGIQGAPGGRAPFFTVCDYSPAGNYVGQFAGNVLPPIGNSPVDGHYPN
ncbi:CAP domain-containing protein [Microdochium trichocladiopsis]|uniref:CAP domain-containing protein n=1 Tax=Microdochium trichocladiopsis TaxID=1682393 RepID=A0A9P8XWH1_9PEZI|nr:CAP domain-containing protein [Microdochium trichocladiopsis]KAH7024509.1 CAP domain-containing protein [Microdochium trichocladiopsis]